MDSYIPALGLRSGGCSRVDAPGLCAYNRHQSCTDIDQPPAAGFGDPAPPSTRRHRASADARRRRRGCGGRAAVVHQPAASSLRVVISRVETSGAPDTRCGLRRVGGCGCLALSFLRAHARLVVRPGGMMQAASKQRASSERAAVSESSAGRAVLRARRSILTRARTGVDTVRRRRRTARPRGGRPARRDN